AMATLLTEAPEVRDLGKPRLAVDRAFTIRGVGTVVTGTLAEGSIGVGSDFAILPGGGTAHVRTAQSHGKAVDLVPPGTRTALNLTGVGLRDGKSGKDGIGRGDVLASPDFGDPALVIDALVEKSNREIRGMKQSKRALKTGREVMFHHGSSGQPARIHFLGQRSLSPGESVLAELRFSDSVAVSVGDRFVIRDASLGLTLAGGVVLDEGANRRAFRKAFQGEFLEARRENPDDLATLVRSQLKRDRVAFLPALLYRSAFREDEIREAVEEQVSTGELERSGDWAFLANWWRGIAGLAAENINEIHRRHPEQLGLPLRDLRSMMEPELPAPKFFDMVLEGLLAGEFAKAGPNIRHREHVPVLPPELKAAGERVRQRLTSDLISPPNKGETATNADEEKALRFLVHTGEVIELDPKTVISSKGFEVIRDEVVDYLSKEGRATASDLRQQTGSVRRILMPLLEQLDDEGITVREGDERRLK
ncbi:MAG: SelB C-terminal domain-containing protein, partial [Verrucomicrobiota bacterium]